jgi:hypothetical protein
MTSLRERVTAWRKSDDTHGELTLLIRFTSPIEETDIKTVEETGVVVTDKLGSRGLRVTDVGDSLGQLEGLSGVGHAEIEATGCQQAGDEGNSHSRTDLAR